MSNAVKVVVYCEGRPIHSGSARKLDASCLAIVPGEASLSPATFVELSALGPGEPTTAPRLPGMIVSSGQDEIRVTMECDLQQVRALFRT